jgi:uncharacterized protein YbjT (DUF2867 family)
MILVVGATGDLGSRVTSRLRLEGQSVRCLVRTSTDDAGLRGIGAEVVHGDLTVPASLGAACGGVGTVIATATAITRRKLGRRYWRRAPLGSVRAEHHAVARLCASQPGRRQV